MDSWNVYPQNAPATPSSAWLCPQNNTQGTDWLHPQNNSTERERNENTALATPTRFIMEYNDLNQNSSSGSYFEGLFEHNFLKLGNQEDLLNNGVYNNEDFSSFLNSNETVPVTTSVPNISVSTSSIPNGINSPTPSLITDDGKDQLYNLSNDHSVQYPMVTSSISGYLADNNQHRQSSTAKSAEGNQIISRKNKQQRTASASSPVSPVTTSASSTQSDSSPISPITNKFVQQRERNCPVTSSSSSSFYQSTPVSTLAANNKDLYIQEVQQRLYPSALSMDDSTLLATSQNLDNRDQYLQSKKHDPKQLLLPLTVGKVSTDSTMSVVITSPSSSLDTDDDIDQYDQTQQRKTKIHRQSGYQDFQLSINTDDLPMQQPSPASSSECLSSGTKSPPSSNETTPKIKKRRALQRKRNSKFHDEVLITPVDESHSDKVVVVATSSGQSSRTVMANTPSESSQSSSTTTSNVASNIAVSNSDTSATSLLSSSDDPVTLTSSCVGIKRNILDDGHDETPEEKRARLLERNRIAAAKCRQKKKQAQESLQQQASDLTQKNTGLHSLVNDLREESLRLKNQLLAHSTCNCNVIQEYVRTSGQFAFARPPYTK